MDSDQAQPYDTGKPAKTLSRGKIGERALPLKRSRLSSELEALRAVSKRTFSSGNRMAVNTFLGAVFDQVFLWEAEDRLEEGLYRLLDALKAPVPLRNGGSVCCGDLLHRAPRGRQTPEQMGSGVAVCRSE
jgi:hypothetical protein